MSRKTVTAKVKPGPVFPGKQQGKLGIAGRCPGVRFESSICCPRRSEERENGRCLGAFMNYIAAPRKENGLVRERRGASRNINVEV